MKSAYSSALPRASNYHQSSITLSPIKETAVRWRSGQERGLGERNVESEQHTNAYADGKRNGVNGERVSDRATRSLRGQHSRAFHHSRHTLLQRQIPLLYIMNQMRIAPSSDLLLPDCTP